MNLNTFSTSLLLLLTLIGPNAVLAQEPVISGAVTHVRDIDTFEVEGVPIRLNGLDGPELSEPYGKEAKAWLIDLINGVEVYCALNGDKTYDRYVGTCYLPNGKDIAELIIENGYGRDCPRYSGGKYKSFEVVQSYALVSHGYCLDRR